MPYLGNGISKFTTADDLTVSGDAAIDTTTLVVDSTNNRVGIGTASPDRSLHIAGSEPSVVFENTGQGTDLKTWRIYSNSSSLQVGTVDDAFSAGQNALEITRDNTDNITGIQFKTGASSERMRLDSSGNLLVGNSTFGAEDGVYISQGGNYVWARSDDTSGYFDRTGSDGKILEFRKDGTTVGSIDTVAGDMVAGTGDTGLRFHDGSDQVYPSNTNGSGRDGAIDLGNSGARFKDGYFSGTLNSTFLQLVASGSAVYFENTSYAIQGSANNGYLRFVTGGSEKARFLSQATPHFLVGCTSAPSSSVAGTAISTTDAGSFQSFGSGTGAATHAVFGNGNGAVGTIQTSGSSTSYNTSSDRRLKSNIQDAESASAKIDAMQVRQFDWTKDGKHQDYGMIAQELQSIEPLAVSGDADSDEMMSVDYSKLVPMLIKEIQELRGRVASLEAS